MFLIVNSDENLIFLCPVFLSLNRIVLFFGLVKLWKFCLIFILLELFNGIFPLFLIKNANIMAPKVSVLRKPARMGSFASCWRYSNVVPLSKGGSHS